MKNTQKFPEKLNETQAENCTGTNEQMQKKTKK